SAERFLEEIAAGTFPVDAPNIKSRLLAELQRQAGESYKTLADEIQAVNVLPVNARNGAATTTKPNGNTQVSPSGSVTVQQTVGPDARDGQSS
ncbi:MAG: hypothetical protein WD229_12950, partial [Pirellulales bacterium]